MRIFRLVWVLWIAAAALSAETLDFERDPRLAKSKPAEDALFQVSTLDALSLGVFQGALSVDDLSKQGDFGLGTFEGLDGEMVVLNNRIYQVRSDGATSRVKSGMTTPFAVVTNFAPQLRIQITKPATYAQLIAAIEPLLPSLNYFYAIKVEGVFDSLTARSVAKQFPPYPTLAAAIAQQTLFPMTNVRGTLVGFRSPQFVRGINQPGFHFHFLRADEAAGGHALDFLLTQGTVEISLLRQHTTFLPETPAFAAAPLPIP